MITHEQYSTLVNAEGNHLVSIVISTSPVGSEEKDRIRFKNAVQQARKTLEGSGMNENDAEQYLAKATELTESFNFIDDSRNGLAVFIGKDVFHHMTLEAATEESVTVGNQFKVAPIVKEMNSQEGEFYLLTLSRNANKLFVARDGQLDAIDTTGIVPKDMDAALLLDDPDPQLQQAGRSDRPGTVFGHGAGKDTEQGHLKAYFDVVDSGVATLLKNEKRPLLLAGVTELIPIYREANQYNHLIEDRYVSGNVDEMATADLYQKAMEALGDYFSGQRKRDHELFSLNFAKGEASTDIRTIVPAAINGRIAVLWVNPDARGYGNYDAATNGVKVSDAKSKDAKELYNLALTHAHQNGARVYVVDKDDMPDPDQEVCAIFRYTVPAVTTNLS